ncbi:MAG: AraC family transcriptional regulator [Acutalibacter sp.]|jgi:AraC family transcriptional regulator|uniref:AraC family transcriptional regulator n=1 Tax=Acutalibacter sp. TaxID=1918636 RepID=UPI00217068C8|nr:AraC family transcriptional regulator [Acutalibacter sp.]MCI9224123.1 AraC family transcriptional regulator [Acutalibacter sp.]
MEWLDRLNSALSYIEDNLGSPPDYETLARIVCCSPYHFQRMFAYLAGMPLSEYIRRRRMSLAAVDLLQGGKVLDVALKYGYSSPTAFNRAFQSVHGCPPSSVREPGASVKSFPPISFKITVKGVEAMNFRIEHREAFTIVGVSVPLERELEKNFQVIPKKWAEASANGTLGKLAARMSGEPKGVLGVSNFDTVTGQGRYYIAVSSGDDSGGLEKFTVPAADWAIFPGKGPNESIQELERRVFTEWLPTSGYEYGEAPDIEVYLSPDPQNAVYEVWVPVVKKKD